MSMGRRLLTLALTALLFGGFADAGDPTDSLEGFNCAMFALNDDLDRIAIKSAAQGYRLVLPAAMPPGVSDFLAKSGDIVIAADELLRESVPDVINDLGRVLLSTTLGALGFGDVAGGIAAEKSERTSLRLLAPGA